LLEYDIDKLGKDDIIICCENKFPPLGKVEPNPGVRGAELPDYITFFPQALHPGLVVWTRLIMEDMKDIGAGEGEADFTTGGVDIYPL
jgi:hypothetical protein